MKESIMRKLIMKMIEKKLPRVTDEMLVDIADTTKDTHLKFDITRYLFRKSRNTDL